MTDLNEIPNLFWPLLILISTTCFTLLWALDAMTHQKLVETDITDKELQTHRAILSSSFIMELSLVLAFWFGYAMLPIFIASFITRTAHEFIDELHFHADRCSKYEANLHLGMWLTVLIKTITLFIWAFILKYKGFEDLPLSLYLWGGIIIMIMGYISLKEWQR